MYVFSIHQLGYINRLHCQHLVVNLLLNQTVSTAVICSGYVSEVRKRDPKVCYPFSRKDSTEPLSIELPPMVVPKFRWWQCNSCVPETSVIADNKEAQKPGENVNAQLALVTQPSKVNVSKVGNAEASTSLDSNDNRNYTPINIVADLKGKGKAHVEDEPAPPSGFFHIPFQLLFHLISMYFMYALNCTVHSHNRTVILSRLIGY